MSRKFKVAFVGLGATGREVAALTAVRRDCLITAAVDRDPGKVGQDLGEVLGRDPLGVEVVAKVEDIGTDVDVAFVATSSRLTEIEPDVVSLVRSGINVVSICEELGYVRRTNPAWAERIDLLAQENGVSVLGTGANPGMVLDTLPLLLSGTVPRIDRIRIRRTTSMAGYGAILSKFGLGLSPADFERELANGTVIGHIGFAESVTALADGLGWELTAVDVTPIEIEQVATTARHGAHRTIQTGEVAAIRQSARGRIGDEAVIDVTIIMGIFEPEQELAPSDHYELEGGDGIIELVAPGGFKSAETTVAIAFNVLTEVVGLEPGLFAMKDLPVAALASKGSR